MEKFNSGTNLSNFYFITINPYDTINNWIIIQSDNPKDNVINVLI
jgi:hypothetical protein